MKIALVSQEFPPDTAHGGIGTQTWNKARWLGAHGHEVHVVSCVDGATRTAKLVQEGGVTVHRMVPPGNAFPVYETAAYWVGYTWSVLAELHGLMRAGPIDLIDFAEYGAEGFAYLLDRTVWNWAPVVVQLHGPLSMFVDRIGWPAPDSDLARVGIMMEDVCIHKADALMACSANIADFTAARHNVARAGIDVVHCGVDAETFQPAAARRGDRPTVLFVGNINRHKGACTVFDAILRLRHKYPGLRLWLAGKPEGELTEELRSRIRSEGAEQTVELCGFIGRDRLHALYQEADIFCSPAQHEPGVANVFIEAMACGIPIVVSNSGGGAEAVVPGETGLLVPPLGLEETTAALDRLLGDPALRARMGAAARRRAEQYFAMDRYMDRVLGVYRRAMATARERRQALEGA